MKSHLSCLVLLACVLPGFVRAQGDVAAQIAELHGKRDDADPKLIETIAEARSRAALDGLLGAYEKMQSLYMRLAIVRVLARFDEGEGGQPAGAKLADLAASSPEPELRDAALAGLGQSAKHGHHFLRQVVTLAADDGVRIEAMRLHIARASAEDAAWYRELWNPKLERKKDAEDKLLPLELDAVRELGFRGLAASLEDTELVETLQKEPNPKIRRAALDRLHEKKSPKAREMARWLFERVDYPGADRANAARVLVAIDGAKAADEFLELASKRDVTPEDLRREMARLLVELGDNALQKKMAKQLGKGAPHEKAFAIYANAGSPEENVWEKIRKALGDKSLEVKRAAARVLAERKDKAALPELEKLLKAKGEERRIAIDAIGAIAGTSPEWTKKLLGFAADEDAVVRIAALEQLGAAGEVAPVLAALAHDDWATRLAAARALERLREAKAVPLLVERMQIERGRMALNFGDILWSLTGQPFGEDAEGWKKWWADAGSSFQVISVEGLAAAEAKREQARLARRTGTPAQFFGVRIRSERVIFVVDVSGSMTAEVAGQYVGKRGATRIDVAKKELRTCIEALPQEALFNVLAFSSGIQPWLKDGIALRGKQSKKDALEFVDRLGAMGATNLYDTLKLAFQDKDVDTIFILSDGEPTNGEVIDPYRIRQDVAEWNRHRGIDIHAVSIGGNLEVLEGIAADAGGRYVRIR
ncbi:MAG: HEAT repeat domain-containing protein [Planctomycetes bacterium]|nr:HEAT repeat domain-containing protein [Planctomycetota bacterium]